MNDKRIAELREKETNQYDDVPYDLFEEALDEVVRLRAKLAITKDGYAVGLAEEVFHPQSDGQAVHRTVWAYGGRFLAYWDHGPPVAVRDCYASLTTAIEVAEEMKKENSDE